MPVAPPARTGEGSAHRLERPVRSLLLLGGAAMSVSAAGIPDNVKVRALLAVGAVLVAPFPCGWTAVPGIGVAAQRIRPDR